MRFAHVCLTLFFAVSASACGGGPTAMEMLYPSICTSGPWPCKDYLKASNTLPTAALGASVALTADTLVVGASGESSTARGVNMAGSADSSAASSGAVYVYRWNGTAWRQEAYIKSSNSEEGDAFGSSVAIYGDTLAVSALGESSNATSVNGDQNNNSSPGSGAVYVFQRTGSTWTQQAYLKASNAEREDRFGSSLSLFGDYLAVGATSEDSGLVSNQADNSKLNSGAAYVFHRSGTAWTQEAYLKAGYPDYDDQFGGSLSLSGDTLAVGASGESSDAVGIDGAQNNNNTYGSGAVYVFTRSGTSWAPQAFIKGSYSGARFAFGTSVSLSGSLLAVGAPNAGAIGIGNEGKGGFYIFERNGITWREISAGNASDLVAGDQFGHTVAISGNRVAVGVPAQASGKGAVYIYEGSGMSWSRTITFPGGDPGDGFGSSVALAGQTLAVGAPGEASKATGINQDAADNSAAGAGAAYVFRQP